MVSIVQNILHQLPAEFAHDMTMSGLRRTQHTALSRLYQQKLPSNPVTKFGLTFPNMVGLAAGLDKNAECIDAFAAMGFGFIEVGTVTPKPQSGNPKPRMFRIPEHQAIINRMGFNNHGLTVFVNNIKQANYNGVLGINIGKNKSTPEDQALQDYLTCFYAVHEYASYVTVNISSPNTQGLRDLQHGEGLKKLLAGLKEAQTELHQSSGKYTPLLVKIAPDVVPQELTAMAHAFNEFAIDGVIATNTTIDKTQVRNHRYGDQQGGLSGKVLSVTANSVCAELKRQLHPNIGVIGVGGIHDSTSAKERLASGADLLQIYSAFIYQGPRLVKHLVEQLS